MCLMPAKCVKCEELFDLRYDYSGDDGLGEKEVGKKNSNMLCWDCRVTAKSSK